jgi:hypothetical protein
MDSIKPAAEIVDEIMADFKATIERMKSLAF